MTKKTLNDDVEANETTTRVRPQRRKAYQPIRETQLDSALIELFARKGYDLKLVRWSIQGEEDYRYLNRRAQEGYEFVTKDEIPDHLLSGLRLEDTRTVNGMLTIGDLCLMKIDSELRQSRREYYRDVTEREIAAVDVHILSKKGFQTNGSRTKVSLREPSFQE